MNSLTDELFSLHARYPGWMSLGMAGVKSTAILALAWGLARLLRHRSATARTWVWRGAFAGLVCLAIWPLRPVQFDAWKIEVLVPTSEVRVSRSALRNESVPEPVALDRTAAPLILQKDTSIVGDIKRTLRALDPLVMRVWWIGFAILAVLKTTRAARGMSLLRRSSKRAEDPAQAACARACTAATQKVVPEVRLSEGIGSPLLTTGRRPVIWLPPDAAAWDARRLDAVLHHEIAHLARNDGVWQWLAALTTCFWWWHPAIWRSLSRLQAETELAADELVLARDMPAPDYAQVLVDIASALLPRPAQAFGLPMLGVSAIEERVCALLRHNPWRGKVGALASTALAVLAMVMGGIVLVSCKQQPPRYLSLAKLVAGGRMVGNTGGVAAVQYQEYLQDFYGTIIETIESAEMRRRAKDRVKALHPDLKEPEVEIQVTQNKGSAIFNVRCLGAEPKYTRTFLDALLDEFIAFRSQIREQQRNKALTTLAEDVVRREKSLVEKQKKLLAFEKQNDVVLTTGANNNAAAKLASLTDLRENYVTQLTDLDLALDDIPSALEEMDRKIKPPAGRDEQTGLTTLEKDYQVNRLELVKLVAERNFMAKETADPEGRAVEVRRKIAVLETVLDEEAKQIEQGWRQSKTNLEKRLKALDSQIEAKRAEALDLNAKIVAHSMLQKEYDEGKRAYDECLALIRRFTVNEDMTSDHVTIMERASASVLDVRRGLFGS